MSKKITQQAKVTWLSMVIGDGHLDKYGNLNILHSDKQLEYLEWKRNLLKKLGYKVSPIKQKINNKKYIAYYFSVGSSKYTKLYRKILYQPKKTITPKILKKFGPLELAIWYMDDGSLTKLKNKETGKIRGSLLRISTHLSKEENQALIDFIHSK